MGTRLFGLRERLIRAAQGPQKADLAAATRLRSWSRGPGLDIPPCMGPALPRLLRSTSPASILAVISGDIVILGLLQLPENPSKPWSVVLFGNQVTGGLLHPPKLPGAPESTTARAPVALCAQSRMAHDHQTSSEHLPGKHGASTL